ncbi:SUMF1/EgtB/PvdO family nonheme iron enzyme [Aquabacterium sp.]|uniref:formylglycine-generating enzyme family protein n=1 Tax=Aquabacterium sp. TaxID=1872578 RepID=UPI00248A662D|nr:SUMF1/EgtB/PvdO family nonheme iron enzyme [Aquabacterium sp.]MDI1350306.1 SUMF1/EgtB/PvdO family nonheme iron enzyme [Aquabacterium sp.]
MGASIPFVKPLMSTAAVVLALTACAQSHAGKAAAQPAVDAGKALVERIKTQLVHLPSGSFEMGDWGSEEGLPYDMEKDSKPLHKVTLDGFSMMAYKVTYDDFDIFTEAVGSPKINTDIERYRPGARKPLRPAKVNWFGAKAFCQWLGQLSGLPFDLPTEAQWEYAARSGGKKLLFATDNGQIDEGRNYPDDSYGPRLVTPEVGAFPPNPAGFYGMLDYTALEWVNDWFQPDYYKLSPVKNPHGPDAGASDERVPDLGPQKVVRGLTASSPAFGGFTFSRSARWPYAQDLSSSKVQRLLASPSDGYSNPAGPQFRCVLNQPARSAAASSLDK